MDKSPLIILLADDDASDRLLFKEALKELKIVSVVNTVNNGIQLMDYLTKSGSPLPHLLFLDLNMPQKNGLECLKEIRSNKKLKEISIVIYSTSGTKRDIEETFNCGANVYIKKPVDFTILRQLLSKVFSDAFLTKDKPDNIENFLLKI